MTEDAELQAKIAALAGQINQAKQQQQQSLVNNHVPSHAQHVPRFNRGHMHWSPYGRGGRGGRGARQPVNRTLIINHPPAPEPGPPNAGLLPDTPPAQGPFIATRKPGMNQLINRDAYDREQKQKLDYHQQTQVAKKQKIDREERTKLNQHVMTQDSREIVIQGIRFQLRADGSKLIRGLGETIFAELCNGMLNFIDNVTSKETPRTVKIADVDFYRTKNGNLVRGNALKDPSRYRLFASSDKHSRNSLYSNHRLQSARKAVQCKHFTKHGTNSPLRPGLDRCLYRTRLYRDGPAGKSCTSLTYVLGTCPHGPMCRFAHDPNKVAVCLRYLKATCTKGDDCDLSHLPTYSNTPACTHFLRGNCTNDACRYPHVNVSPTAPVCAPFARLGFCETSGCDKRHVLECPDYANTGHCAKAAGGRCHLPHPDRASALRKAAAKQSKMNSDNDSDVSSDEEDQDNLLIVDDVDSDDLEDMTMIDAGSYGHELTQQNDYIGFS